LTPEVGVQINNFKTQAQIVQLKVLMGKRKRKLHKKKIIEKGQVQIFLKMIKRKFCNYKLK